MSGLYIKNMDAECCMAHIQPRSSSSVNTLASSSFQTTTSSVPLSSQIVSLESHASHVISNNISAGETYNVHKVQECSHNNTIAANEEQLKQWPHLAASQIQPLIIGNVNAASILTAALNNKRDNAMVNPPEISGPSALNGNSVFGIMPIIVQQRVGDGLLQMENKFAEGMKNRSLVPMTIPVTSTQVARSIPSEVLDTVVSESLAKSASSHQPGLASSDTVILHRLSSEDTIKLNDSSQSQNMTSASLLANSQNNLLSSTSSFNSSFSFLPRLSDKSISLSSIPTISLLSIPQSESANTFGKLSLSSLPSLGYDSMPSISLLSDSSSGMLGNHFKQTTDSHRHLNTLVQSTVEEGSKNQNDVSEPGPVSLQIGESRTADQPSLGTGTNGGEVTSLCRADTVILKVEPSEGKEGNTMSSSDTVILDNAESRSRLSEGFTVDSMQPHSSRSVNTDENVLLSSDNSDVVFTNLDKPPTNTSLDTSTLQSFPNIVLTDSVINGMYNPNALSSLLSLSQSGSIQQPIFLTNFTLDQGQSESNLRELNAAQVGNAVQLIGNLSNIQVEALNQRSMVAAKEASDSFSTCENSSSVKGTQTDWIFGNSSVYLKTQKRSDHCSDDAYEMKNFAVANQTIEIVDGTIPSSIVLTQQEDEEVDMDGPLILDEQGVPASVLSLIPPHVSLYNSTANMSEAVDEVTYTTLIPQMETETSRPLFPCTDCDQAFLTKQELNKHTKQHKRLLKCDLCTATFTVMGNYTRHRKIHNLHPEVR